MSCTNSNKPPVLQLQQVPQLPTYPDASAPGDKEAVVDQYRNDLNRALYKNIQQLNNALSPAPGVDGTNGAAGAGGGLINMVSPLTTKGDIWGYSTNNTRIPVGSDGTVLTADSTNALGVSYQAAAGGTVTISLPATQALSAGDLVNIFSSSGTPSVRKASATSGFEAHGFTNAAVANGATCTVQLAGLNTHSSGLTAGRVFLHTTDGIVSNTCPSTAGQMGQEVGEAYASGSYNFAWHPGVLLATTHTAAPAGALQSQEFTSSGTYTPPSGVTSVWLTMIGGGGAGGGSNAAALGGGGGGSGEQVANLPVAVSGAVTVTVPGAATGVSGASGNSGGDVSFGSQYVARGGGGGLLNGSGGIGGGVRGATSAAPVGAGQLGAQEAVVYFGGSGGGGAGNTTATAGAVGGGSGPNSGASGGASASSQAGGGGGASSIYGAGGAGGAGGSNGSNATAANYGAGGGGGGGKATNSTGGSGAPGYVLVQWVA